MNAGQERPLSVHRLLDRRRPCRNDPRAEENIAAVGAETIVVPGHGPVGDKADLLTFRNMLVTIRERVGWLKKEGRTLADVIAVKPTAAYDAKWGGFFTSSEAFTALVYAGV
jgi:hypothetical protein